MLIAHIIYIFNPIWSSYEHVNKKKKNPLSKLFNIVKGEFSPIKREKEEIQEFSKNTEY